MEKYCSSELDINLFHLHYSIMDLQAYKFDYEIIKQLDILKSMVEKRLYCDPIPKGHDIKDTKAKIVYYLEK